MKARKYFLSGISLVVLASCTFTGCGRTQALSDSTEQVISTSVETLALTEGSIESYKTISSSILAQNEIAVIPKVGGTVSKVYVKVGDHVKAGDILFEIDSKDIEIQVKSAQSSANASQATLSSAEAGLSSAKANLSSAEAGLSSAKANYNINTGSNLDNQLLSQKANIENLERQYNDLLRDLDSNKALLEAGAVSQNTINTLETQIATTKTNLDQAKSALKILEEQTIEETKRAAAASVSQAEAYVSQSEASVSQAQSSISQAQASAEQAAANLENAKQQLSYTKVVAEIDGIVSNCMVTEGSTVGAGGAALNLIDIDQVKISFNVTGDLINTIHTGNTVYTYIDAISNEPFEGMISTIAPAADAKTGLYPVEIQIANSNHELKPGMFATSKLVLSQNNNAISVPINAVIEKNNEKYLFAVDENQIAHKVIVETGIENETHIEITSGVSIGDTIVIKGQDYLSEGSLVNVVATN